MSLGVLVQGKAFVLNVPGKPWKYSHVRSVINPITWASIRLQIHIFHGKSVKYVSILPWSRPQRQNLMVFFVSLE